LASVFLLAAPLPGGGFFLHGSALRALKGPNVARKCGGHCLLAAFQLIEQRAIRCRELSPVVLTGLQQATAAPAVQRAFTDA
jgi:hypothetical protein